MLSTCGTYLLISYTYANERVVVLFVTGAKEKEKTIGAAPAQGDAACKPAAMLSLLYLLVYLDARRSGFVLLPVTCLVRQHVR